MCKITNTETAKLHASLGNFQASSQKCIKTTETTAILKLKFYMIITKVQIYTAHTAKRSNLLIADRLGQWKDN